LFFVESCDFFLAPCTLLGEILHWLAVSFIFESLSAFFPVSCSGSFWGRLSAFFLSCDLSFSFCRWRFFSFCSKRVACSFGRSFFLFSLYIPSYPFSFSRFRRRQSFDVPRCVFSVTRFFLEPSVSCTTLVVSEPRVLFL